MVVTSERADTDLQRRVFQYLSDRNMPGLRRLAVSADGGTVKVSGRVRTFYEKQLCQHICQRVAGVVKLIDDVSVADTRFKMTTCS